MELCLGTAQFGMDYGIQSAGQPKLAEAIEMLETAVQNGVSAIDTAAAYGTAEEVVGEFIKKHGGIRDRVSLISKLSPTILNGVPQEQYAAVIRENLMQSLSKLNTDYLDGYLLHNAEHIYNEAIADALFQIKKDGLTRNVGVSVYTPDEAKKGMERGFDILQIPYSVFDQRMDEYGVLDLAQSKGTDLHARSTFTQGLMLMDEADIPAHLEKARPVVRKLTEFCKNHNISRLHLALAFVARQKAVSHLVFGVDGRRQLLEIVCANRHTISDDVLVEAMREFSCLEESIIMPSKWVE